MQLPTPASARPGLWSRRWVRRLTYLLASGAVVLGLAGWASQRPEVDRWVVARLDRYARGEFGLGVAAERLELHPFQGRIVIHGLAVGGDLFQAERLEVQLEWASLLHVPHLRELRLQAPVLNLDRTRLAAIHLRPHPERQASAKFRLDRLVVSAGRAHVREPAWGLPEGDFRFQLSGRGWAANQLQVDLQVPGISLGHGPRAVQGGLAVLAGVNDQGVQVDQGRLRLGDNRVEFKGGFRFRPAQLRVSANGHIDLAQAQALAAPGSAPAASGVVDFQGQAEGAPDRLAWSATLHGQELRAKVLPLHPGSLQAQLRGGPGNIRLDQLAWASQDGRLEASGAWSPTAGGTLKLAGNAIPLAPVAGYTHTGFLQDLTAAFHGEARVAPGPAKAPWSAPRIGQLSFHGGGEFRQDGRQVGGLEVDLEHGRFQARSLELTVPQLELHGSASGTLNDRGLVSVESEAAITTDATDVAGVLKAWDIAMEDDGGRRVALDMAGRAQAQAQFLWEREAGIQLTGQIEVQQPRWHGAQADHLSADVAINGELLRVSNILLDKGEGHGYGDMWVTWADLPPGRDQIDMCYRATRLPVRDGLRAADQGDLQLDGIGSGWVRLHGPFDRMVMDGQAVAEQAVVYGLKLPAVSGDFHMDLAADRLTATDLRVADRLDHLQPTAAGPTGPLALQGSMDMDVDRETWQANLHGDLDSMVLGLPGPRFQAKVDASMDGPLTAPLGPIPMPTGSLTITEGRITQDGETLGGLEGRAAFAGGMLEASLGLAGKPDRLATVKAAQHGKDHLAGTLDLDLGPRSADTAELSTRLTQDFLKDAHFRFHAQGDWGPGGLAWNGQMERFFGQFEGFSLAQASPGQFHGDGRGMELSLDLEGRAALPTQTPPVAPPAAGTSGPGRPWRGRRLPIGTSLALRGRVPFTSGSPMALHLAGSSDLANLKTMLDRVVRPGQFSLLADLHLEGNAQFDLNLGGTLPDTTLDGTLTLKSGRAVAHGYPLSAENLDFTARFQGRDVIIPKTAPLRGTFAQGALTAWGQATWSLGGISAYDLHTSLEDFQLRDLPEGFELQGSLDANLKGSDRDGGRLTGSIWAKRALYRTEINLSDLILANAMGGTRTINALDPSDPLSRIDLDLEVHLAEPWDLDTNLVKMQGRPLGPFWIRGNLTDPGLKGRMELLPGGRVTNLFPAGDIVLERGTVDFNDPTFFNPLIDVQGQIDIPPYLVTVAISGTLDALQARPYSTPSLRQDEIFAILIDPAAVTQVGGAPGSSTQTALNTGLASTGTGLLTSLALANFQEQLRKALNLDRVSVALRAGIGAPETSITLGTSFNLLGYRTPLVFTHDKDGEVTTISGQAEWRFGNFVLSLGASQSTADSLAPSGEIRHSWSPP